MLVLETPKDALQQAGREMGVSEWLTVTQDMIDKFADATGDHQWIHVDVERARREMPGGKTIAHGYLTLSLIPRLRPQLIRVERQRQSLNYGLNRVRFVTPVPAGVRVRLRGKLVKAEEVEGGGVRLTSEMTMEVEGSPKPAMVAETIAVVYGET
jgi:acyl dehydratase